jgi:uncharacterized membrane protein
MAKKKREKKRSVKRYIQILYCIGILVLFYFLGFSVYFIAAMGLVFILLIFLKGKLYRKIESFMDKILPFLAKLNPTVRKIIIIFIFVLFWILLKQIILFVLKLAGIDMEKIVYESMNNSISPATHGSSSSSGLPTGNSIHSGNIVK